MTFIPPGERVIETKKCRLSGTEFIVTDKDLEFYNILIPVFDGIKQSLPSPTLCPRERHIRRMMWRNYDYFYKNTCCLTGKEIISIYKPGTVYKVASLESWWSDDWSPHDYALNFDFNRPFFEQFHHLDTLVPHMPNSVSKSENSKFTNFSINNRNCYLCSRVAGCEECYFDFLLKGCKNCFDCSEITDSEYLYECIRTIKSYHCFYCLDSENCRDCYFLRDCLDCTNCFGSCNLKSAQYVFNNQQLTEEDYRKKISQFLSTMTSGHDVQQKFLLYSQSFPKKYATGFHNENVLGNYTFSSSDIVFGFGCHGSQNLRYNFGGFTVSDSIDVSFGYYCEKSIEVCGIATGYGNYFCVNNLEGCHDIFYSKDCVNASHDCFGCVSLKKGQNCILNTPFSKHEYDALCNKIVDHMSSTGEWGEFFPSHYSPYCYNESAAHKHFPSTREEALQKSFLWFDGESSSQQTSYQPLPISQYNEKIVGFEAAKKNIDSLLSTTIFCIDSGKPFKIIPKELAFYIQNSLPIPLRHPQIRLEYRMKQALSPELYERNCHECGSQIFTAYAPDRPEKILCEECYRKLVY